MNNLTESDIISASICDLRWEKTRFIATVKVQVKDRSYSLDKLSFFAVNGENVGRFQFDADCLEDGTYEISVDVIHPGINRGIARGTHTIAVCNGDDVLCACMTDPSIVKSMADKSRTFLFDGRSRAYVISFFVEDDSETELPFVMHTITVKSATFSRSDGEYKPFKAPNLAGIQAVRKKVAKVGRTVLNRPLPINTNALKTRFYKEEVYNLSKTTKSKPTLLFMSEQNAGITANQEAVYKRLVERGDDKKFEILMSFRASVAQKQSDDSWREFLRKLARADIIIMDDHAPVMDWLVLRPETIVIQLWHAGAGFKSSGYSRWGNKGCPSTFSCHRQYTYGIAGSRQIAHFFSEVWGINTEQVLPTGMPRMDEYLDKDYRKDCEAKLYEQYPQCKGKKVILFAPTYRGKNRATAHYPFELIDFDKLSEVCGDEYVVLFKMHPWVADSVPIPEKYSDKFLDVGKYPNINDLFYITELLITDYSSNIFEYSLMLKPMLFFAYDEIQYSFSRGFHRDYEESTPGKIVRTFDELLDAIRNKDFEFEKVQKYVDVHFDYIDTHASDRVIDWLILGNMPEDLRKSIDDKLEDADYVNRLRFPAVIDEPETIDFSCLDPAKGEDEIYEENN